ncbi:hypothetical protein HN371_04050 [Candidatus Poribacteria bacterium]|jgi:hypothetical protein|nr:hypothetical protein [Candidatus Poribacteria bacterium]MBT5710546.1 hypothetical protein [Candidatus Poribacteria bacterium]MBT7096039.1 hypothetical protein [Candidatus Poribacteria bacterium]MBT7805192.1 hypothetical protein [Candidatus Poribacteria bacterium]
MIPLISSICHGPLEVCQLPRFWWKVLLRAQGMLDGTYPDCSGGLDTYVLDVLGLDKDATLKWIRQSLPTYLDFEDWVLAQSGGAIDREAADAWNESVRTRIHTRPEKIAETYGDIGLPADAGIDSAVILNALQDWQLFHASDVTRLDEPLVPLISTIDYGPLGVCQLPRTWLKCLLRAGGMLHEDYPHLRHGDGLDWGVLTRLGLDPTEATGYIRAEQPDYCEFESWVEANGHVDADVVAEWNQFVRTRVRDQAKIDDISATVGRPLTTTSGVVLNHVEDWHYAYVAVMGAA